MRNGEGETLTSKNALKCKKNRRPLGAPVVNNVIAQAPNAGLGHAHASVVATLGLRICPGSWSKRRPTQSSMLFWAFPHIYVRSGYILGAIGCACVCRLPPRTKPRYAGLVPKGSLSLTQMRTKMPFLGKKSVFLAKKFVRYKEKRVILEL